MNLFFRLFWVFLTSFSRPKLTGLEVSRIGLLTFPNDLDVNLHVNNGRYLTLMDLGRIDLIFRLGMFAVLRKNGWSPVVASIHTDFRRSLKAFQRFDITTEIIGWDDKWIFMAQKMERNGKEVASAVMKTVFLSKTGKVAPKDLVKAMGYEMDSPQISQKVLQQLERDRVGTAKSDGS